MTQYTYTHIANDKGKMVEKATITAISESEAKEHGAAIKIPIEYITLGFSPSDNGKTFELGKDFEWGYQRFLDGPDKWVNCEKIEYDNISEQIWATNRRIIAVPISKPNSVIKYLIEDKRTDRWLCLGEMMDTSKHDDSHWESKWTNDANRAIQWDHKFEAEAYNKKFFNMADIEVTEHEFPLYFDDTNPLSEKREERTQDELWEMVDSIYDDCGQHSKKERPKGFFDKLKSKFSINLK